MLIYSNHFTRPVSSSIIHNGAWFSWYCCLHRRFYTDKKSPLNHYDALGVHTDASAKEIKAAFYTLSKKYHPDVNPNDINAATKFSIISNAYDILNDPIKRRDYDNELLSRTYTSDPYATYAQQARDHRASTRKPPFTSSSSGGGFQGAESAFGNSRSTSHGTFGRYRDPSNAYGFDEFYRTDYSDFKNWHEAKEQVHREQEEEEEEENKRQQKANRTTMSKPALFSLWLSFGLAAFFTSSLLHIMRFQQPTDEFRSKFVITSKSSNDKSYHRSSSKS